MHPYALPPDTPPHRRLRPGPQMATKKVRLRSGGFRGPGLCGARPAACSSKPRPRLSCCAWTNPPLTPSTPQIFVIYYSTYGHIKALAQQVKGEPQRAQGAPARRRRLAQSSRQLAATSRCSSDRLLPRGLPK